MKLTTEHYDAMRDGASALRYRAERLRELSHPTGTEAHAMIEAFRQSATVLDGLASLVVIGAEVKTAA